MNSVEKKNEAQEQKNMKFPCRVGKHLCFYSNERKFAVCQITRLYKKMYKKVIQNTVAPLTIPNSRIHSFKIREKKNQDLV